MTRTFFSAFTRILFTVPLFLMLAACGGRPPAQMEPPTAIRTENLEPGDMLRSLVYDGIERTYVLHIPAGYDPAHPLPLVLAFHGIGLDADEMIRISGLNEQADSSGFIVVYPNGTGENRSWNGGHCCGEAARDNVDDVGFVRALIDELDATLDIEMKRVYATGFSNGAIMVYRLACELSDRITAISPVAATQILDDQQACHPQRGVPVIHFHGTADRLNPYDGGITSAGFQFLAVADAITFWVAKNGCPNPVQRTESGSIRHDVYTACSQNATVELYTILDGEHAWPGGEAVSAQVGEPTMEILATPLMWAFFDAHPLP